MGFRLSLLLQRDAQAHGVGRATWHKVNPHRCDLCDRQNRSDTERPSFISKRPTSAPPHCFSIFSRGLLCLQPLAPSPQAV